jgi:hypothetical protein
MLEKICLKVTHHHPNYSHARACYEWQGGRCDDSRLLTALPESGSFELFTFGSAHRHPITGEDLFQRCVIWRGSGEVPRCLQFQRFGSDWAFNYRSDKALAVMAAYNYRPLMPAEIPPIRTQADDALQRWVDYVLADAS